MNGIPNDNPKAAVDGLLVSTACLRRTTVNMFAALKEAG
jgi:hypothetical protein